jgi:competence protein ComFB
MHIQPRYTTFDVAPFRNYYETLILELLNEQASRDLDNDTLHDIACIALNSLPAKYIRHDVDMAFFNTREETEQMRANARQAIAAAEQKLRNDPRHTT